jgi:Na+-translocating ferredoxin:NAD+ oxidoreductase subunit B
MGCTANYSSKPAQHPAEAALQPDTLIITATAVSILGGIALTLATGLVLINRRLHVAEDPRLDIVEEMLPGNNCGACGFPGCRAFSEALVGDQAKPASCSVSDAEGRSSIAAFLGVDVGQREKVVARLACAGGSNVARQRALYQGLGTCRAAATVGGGGKSCSWGCLGLADCRSVCDFDAITMDAHSLPVVDEERCTACGDCVEVCPKDLFELHPATHRLWVACKSLEAGDHVLDGCEIGCTACGRCALDAPDGLITMRDNLPVVDYGKDHTTRDPIERCPTGAIVWLGKDGPSKGRESSKVLRKSPLPPAAT